MEKCAFSKLYYRIFGLYTTETAGNEIQSISADTQTIGTVALCHERESREVDCFVETQRPTQNAPVVIAGKIHKESKTTQNHHYGMTNYQKKGRHEIEGNKEGDICGYR